ncbi:hypothetical protein F5888DRAFT_1109084 [Russula emetica]|nr:hypothetical protein F5888DRAFT_1109084 [Russula emetica]
MSTTRCPDDVLLEIFYIYVDEDVGENFGSFDQRIEEWITLAHVCRRWRTVVFQSPHRLNLRLHCTPNTRARDTLDIWPPLPLVIQDFYGGLNRMNGTSGVDNIIAALEHNNRVCQINFSGLTSSRFKSLTDSAAMHKPFPELTDLRLGIYEYDDPEEDDPGLVLLNSFLAGSAPRLRSLTLYDVPFPGLPNLLSSATHLVNLYVSGIPRPGYIPPEAMATSLSALTSLESLRIDFRDPPPRSAPETRCLPPPPPTRSILPSLTEIVFEGASEYLEEILARIDAPRLNKMHINFFNQIIFDTPQLFHFISRKPPLRTPEMGHITFSSEAVTARFPSQTSDCGVLNVEIPYTASGWQPSFSSLEQVCTSSLPPISTLENLYILEDRRYPPRWQDDIENTL